MSAHSDDSPPDVRELLTTLEAVLGKRDRLLGDIAKLDRRFDQPLIALERHGPERGVRAPAHTLKRYIEKHTPLDRDTPTTRARSVQGAMIALALPPSKITHATLTWAVEMIQKRAHTDLEDALDHLFAVAPEALFEDLHDAIDEALASEHDGAPNHWPRARYRLAWARRGEDPERLIEELSEGVTPTFDDPESLFDELLLQRLDKRLRNTLLPFVIDAVEFTHARRLLEKVGAPDHALLIDGLAVIILESPIHVTRLAAIEAIERIANPRAEDLLAILLEDPGAGIRSAACSALGALGTPRVLRALQKYSDIWGTHQMRRDCDAAIQAIRARHPEARGGEVAGEETIGALTLSLDDSIKGALSPFRGEHGALSLTHDTSRAHPIARAGSLDTKAWYRLEVAPRDVPRASWAELLLSRNRAGQIATALLLPLAIVGIVQANLSHGALPLLVVIWFIASGYAIAHAIAKHNLLARGVLTLGRAQASSGDDGEPPTRTIELTTSDGREHTHTSRAQHAYTDTRTLPVLYLPEPDPNALGGVLVPEEVETLGIDASGKLTTSTSKALFYLGILSLHPILWLAVLLSHHLL